jgi:hypothetical protein
MHDLVPYDEIRNQLEFVVIGGATRDTDHFHFVQVTPKP